MSKMNRSHLFATDCRGTRSRKDSSYDFAIERTGQNFSVAFAGGRDRALRMRCALRWLVRVSIVAAFGAFGSGAELHAQQASVLGVVLRDSSEKPITGAEIVLSDPRREARSDSSGKFSFRDIKPGQYKITVRLVGYQPLDAVLRLEAGTTLEPEFILTPVVTSLESVTVRASASDGWSSRLQDFEERRKSGAGRFLTAEAFQKVEGRSVSSILAANIPGLRIVRSGGRQWMASLRGCGRYCPGQPAPGDPPPPPNGQKSGSMEKIPTACYMQVFVNGLLRYSGRVDEPMFDIDELNSNEIIGLEYYTVSTTPLQYRGTTKAAPCGTVLIWTKG